MSYLQKGQERMPFLVEGSVRTVAADMETRMGSKHFSSDLKSTAPSNRLEVAAGGITFKTESMRNFENIFLEPERELDEPKTGLEDIWGRAACKAGEAAVSSGLDQKSEEPTWVNL